MSELLWAAGGAGATVLCAALAWVWWRLRGPGVRRAYVSADEEPEGTYRIVMRKRTPTQKIAVVEHRGQTLIYGNGYVMFGTAEDDTLYAEALVHVPMAVAAARHKVLIIGGGGGITTREALRYPEVQEITTIDVDPVMMDFGKKLPALVRFNEGALNHPKVRTVIADGREFVAGASGRWDVVIIDIPEPSKACPELRRLFSVEFYRQVRERLTPGGTVAVAASLPAQAPDYFWSVAATLQAAGFHTLPYRLDLFVEYEEDWGFVLAAQRPVTPAEIRIAVPTRCLGPERVREMFTFPYGIARCQHRARVQTDRNHVLLQMHDGD